MILKMLFGPGRREMKDGVVRIGWIDNHLAVVSADRPPFVEPCFEVGVLDKRKCGAPRIFDDLNIVDQKFAGVEQPEAELIEGGGEIGSRGANCRATVGVCFPLGSQTLITRSPSFRFGVVRIRINQFKTRSSSIGEFWPTTAIVIMHLIHRIQLRVDQDDAFMPIVEPPCEITQD